MIRERTVIALLCCCTAMSASCGSDEHGEEPTTVAHRVVVYPAKVSVTAATSKQLSAQVNDAAGKPVGLATIDFSSSNPAIVTVSERGLIHAVGPVGTATVTVQSGKKKREVKVTVKPGVAARIEIATGDGQTAAVTKALGEPIVVKVTDRSGNPIGGSTVTFEVEGGLGKISPKTVTVGPSGTAKAYWTLGNKAGLHAVTASSPGLKGSPITFSSTATPGPAARIKAISGPPKRLTAGESVPLRVQVTDEYGNSSSAVEIAWSLGEGKATVVPERGKPDSSGVAEAKWTVVEAGRATISAAAAGLQGSPIRFKAQVAPAAPAKLGFVEGDRQIGPVGKPVRTPPAVRVVDAYGNPVPGAAVSFLVTRGAGKVQPKQVPTDERGIAAVRLWTLGDPGINALKAYLGSADGPSAEAQAVASGYVSVTGPGVPPERLQRLSAVPAADPVKLPESVLTGALKIVPGGTWRDAGTGCKALPAKSLKGAVAILRAGKCEAATAEKHLAAAGAIGILVYHTKTTEPIVLDGFRGALPVWMIGRIQARRLATWVRDNQGGTVLIGPPRASAKKGIPKKKTPPKKPAAPAPK